MPNAISRSELLELHNSLGIKARALMVDKNHDYAAEADVFRNFRTFGTLGVLVRLSDKLARLRSFEENQVFRVTDEKLVDTILDILNYAVIYYAMKQEEQTEPPANVVSITTPIVTDVVRTGPYCNNCDTNLADFRKDNGKYLAPRYWCSDCACVTNTDTSDMTLMGQAG